MSSNKSLVWLVALSGLVLLLSLLYRQQMSVKQASLSVELDPLVADMTAHSGDSELAEHERSGKSVLGEYWEEGEELIKHQLPEPGYITTDYTDDELYMAIGKVVQMNDQEVKVQFAPGCQSDLDTKKLVSGEARLCGEITFVSPVIRLQRYVWDGSLENQFLTAMIDDLNQNDLVIVRGILNNFSQPDGQSESITTIQ